LIFTYANEINNRRFIECIARDTISFNSKLLLIARAVAMAERIGVDQDTMIDFMKVSEEALKIHNELLKEKVKSI
jgi:hypothetical protein